MKVARGSNRSPAKPASIQEKASPFPNLKTPSEA
jgi:hypothetical protein